MYMKAEEGDAVIAWASSFFERAMFVLYEQINPNDTFGKMMMQNLEVEAFSVHDTHFFSKGSESVLAQHLYVSHSGIPTTTVANARLDRGNRPYDARCLQPLHG